MWHYVLLLLRRQLEKSVLASSGFFLAACALILLSATTQTTVAQGNQIISQSWRSSYDLVVLPPQAQYASQNTIPADLLEGYNGGISTQQYEQIRHLSGVEVAAPIAFVGYVQMPVPQLNFFYTPLPTGFYRVDLRLVVFTGQRQIVERGQSTLYYHFSSCDSMPAPNTPAAQVLDALGNQDVITQCGTEQIFNTTPPVDPGTFLMAAIDPTAENQLVHLDKTITAGRMLTTQDTIHFDTNPQMGITKNCPTQNTPLSQCSTVPNYDIPVLFQTQLPGQITLKGSFTRLSPASLDPKTAFARGGFVYLAHLPSLETIFDGEIPLVQNDPQRFSVETLVLENHNWLPYTPYYGIDPYFASLRFLYTPSSLTYASIRGPDGQANSAYTLVADGTQGPEAAFRPLQPLHIAEIPKPTRNRLPLPKAFYFFDFIGKIAGNTLNAQFSNPLNWLPENTYASPPTVLRYDAQGNAVTPTNLLPTNNTAGFILQPPLALTTLSAAVNLRGNDIISAIRIRVSGIDVANPASWKRIQQVAGLIEQRTHLRVLVTLGSSPRPTLIYVPGVKQGQFGSHQNIDPVGWVEERWISIGVSILYLAQLGATRLLLIGAVLAVCLGYLVVAFSSLVASQRTEFAILSALGWRPWQPSRLFLVQALLLALVGGLLGLGVALLIATLLNATPLWLIVIWTLPAILVMALLSSLYPLWLIWRIRPAEILRTGTSITSAKTWLPGLRLPLWSFVSPILALVLRNLARSRLRTLLTVSSLFLSALLLVVMFSGVLALRQTLTGTLLGDFVLLQTAVPQIAGCVFALLLSFMSITDLLLLQARERQREIGLLQALGWRTELVQRLFAQEGLILAVIGALPGVLAAQWILTIEHSGQNLVPPVLIALGVMILMLLIAALATIPALYAINRMRIVDIVRAE